MFDRPKFKRIAKEVYKNKPIIYISLCLICSVLTVSIFPSNVQVNVSTATSLDDFKFMYNSYIVSLFQLSGYRLYIGAFAISSLLMPFASIVLRYIRDLAKGGVSKNPFHDIDSVIFMKMFMANIIANIMIIFGFVLFVFPGIYLMYGFRYVGLVAMDYPELSIVGILKKNLEITKGYKWNLFVMELSFLGWILIASLITMALGEVAGFIASIILSPYMTLTDLTAYETLRAEEINQEDPIDQFM